MLYRWIIVFILVGIQLSWGSDSFSYSGRLVNADGSPVSGPVNLKAELAYSNDTTIILCSQDFTTVSLTHGVFHIKLDLDCTPKTINQVLAETPATHSVAIRITDTSNSKAYSFQALHSMPYSNVSKQLVQMGATDGQVLTWGDGQWKPLAPAAVESGSIGTTELEDGSVTNSKLATGINRSKLANGTGNYVLVNDGSGLVSETPYLSIAQGGTGATTVPGVFASLGLGSAATADLGLTTGNALGFDDVEICLATEKLMLTAAPTVQWTCVPENTSVDSTKLPLAGGTMTGDINMGSNRIVGLGEPVDADEAVNKTYVDTLSEINWKASGTHVYYNNTGNVGVGVVAPVEKIDVAGNVALTGGIRLRSGTNYVELKAPALTGNVLFVLPTADGGPGQVLKTDGAGNLSWIDSTAGSITSVAATLPLSATTSSGSTTVSLNYDGSTIGINASNQIHIPNGGITNTQINATAAIDWIKINKLGSAAADIGAASELVSIVAGTGLIGGGTLEADRIINVNVGNGPDQIVQMDSAGKLPAVDGSQLTNLPLKWLDATGGINYPIGNVGIGVTSPNEKLTINGNVAVSGKIRLKDSGTNYVELSAPLTTAGVSYTLPGSLGENGQALITDNLGNLSWATLATGSTSVGGDISGTISSATINLNSIDSSKIVDSSIVDADISTTAAIAQSKISGLVTALGNKQDVIAASDNTKYFRGDKTWQTLNTDSVPEGTKLYFTEPLVLGTDLFGFVTGAGTVSASDTIMTAIQKLDGNIGAVSAAQGNYILRDGTSIILNDLSLSNKKIINLSDPTLAQDAATKSYVDSKATEVASKWSMTGSDIYYNSGYVGIGTMNPEANLHVTGIGVLENNAVSSSSSHLSFRKTRNSTATQHGDDLGQISFYGHDGTSLSRSAYIVSRAEGPPTAGSVPGHLSFFTTPALGTDSSERLRITSSGNVGINNSDPQASLDVKGVIRLTGSTSGFVGLTSAPVAGSTVYTLPAADGSNGHLLKTDGAGVLSWIAPPSTEPTGAAGGDLTGTYPNPTIIGLAATKIADGSIDNTEFSYINGVTSNIQNQLDTKQGTIAAGAVTDYWRGDKTWQNLDAAARSALLFGYSVTAGTVASGDSIQTAIGKLDGNVLALGANGQWDKSGSDISYSSGKVGVGTATPHASSILDVSSTTQGFLPPRMTEVQRNAITTPAAGLTIFNTSTSTLQIYTGTGWYTVGQNIPNGAIMAFASSTCPEGWAEYTPAYGRFLRGIDKSGSSIDPWGLRAAGSLQDQDWKGFSMTDTLQNVSTGYSHGPVDMGKSTSSFIGNLFTGKWENPSTSIGVKWNGADEVRPKNVAVLYCSYSGTSIPLAPGATEIVQGNTEVNVSDTGTDGKISLIAEGVEAVTVTSNGNVGIGTPAPQAKLDVAGDVKFGNSSVACSASSEGQQRYNSGIKNMEFCDGTSWRTLGSPVLTAETFSATGNVAGLVGTTGGVVGYTTKQNSNAAVFSNLGTSGIKILKGGKIHVSYNQDVICGGSYSYSYITVNGSTIIARSLNVPSSTWAGLATMGSYTVAANDVLAFHLYCSGNNFTSLDSGDWSIMSIFWAGN